ncbi:hypothetical protein R3P38DRAFT_2781403 [Favolaschia claudopus]|uniref:Uncharacterized protein n=1 Tax=Favolaschia claudopus TaxID=2862362 RepID=A0AAW0B5Z9_9AGAR
MLPVKEEEEVAARAERRGTGALRARGTEAIILLLDPRISSRHREEVGDVFERGLRSAGEKDSADRAIGGMEVDKEKILIICIVNGDPHDSELLDSISHSTGSWQTALSSARPTIQLVIFDFSK